MSDENRTTERWNIVAAVEREIRLMSYTSAGDPSRVDDMKMHAMWAGRLQKAIDAEARTHCVRRHLTSMQRKGGERVREKLAGKSVRIWSAEHGAWWRPDRCGYTTHAEVAGIYTAEEAWLATKHCGPEKRIVFEVVP